MAYGARASSRALRPSPRPAAAGKTTSARFGTPSWKTIWKEKRLLVVAPPDQNPMFRYSITQYRAPLVATSARVIAEPSSAG